MFWFQHPQNLYHFSINSISKIPSSKSLKSLMLEFGVWFILGGKIPLHLWTCETRQVTCFKNTLVRHKIDIPILRWRNRKEKEVMGPKQVRKLAGQIPLDFRLETNLLWFNAFLLGLLGGSPGWWFILFCLGSNPTLWNSWCGSDFRNRGGFRALMSMTDLLTSELPMR